jgi:hypothetical protein
MTHTDAKFRSDAAQTAYLWYQRDQYGTVEKAVQALARRQSAKGRSRDECKHAFDVGLRVVQATAAEVDSLGLKYSSEEAARRTEEEIRNRVANLVPEADAEMLQYAMGMMFWMPLMG